MGNKVSSDIAVKVETFYMDNISEPNKYFYKYRITIKNESDKIVRLLSRQWVIMDLLEWPREIEGAGVVGETPILEPGESFTYISGLTLKKRIGTMRGKYIFQNLNDKTQFEVKIPKFLLLAGELSN